MKHKLRYSGAGDFVVNDMFTFEIGGHSKTRKQIAAVKNSWVVADNLEISVVGKIPLWLFGFTY